MRLYLAAFLLACAAAIPAAAGEPQYYHRHEGEKVLGYSQAVRMGEVLYISGTVGGGEMADAVKQAYDRLKETLAAHGLGFEHVVRETVYTTDIEAFVKQKDLRKAYYGNAFPAATWLQIQRLVPPKGVVEVELTAVFPPAK